MAVLKKIKRLIKNISLLMNNDVKTIYPRANDEYVGVINQAGNQLLVIDGKIIPKIETTVITQEPEWGNGMCHVQVSFLAKIID